MNCKRITVGFAALCALTALGGPRAHAQSALQPAEIDRLIRVEWQKEDVVPSAPVDDARYLRRIYLDITGTIPPAEVVSDFLSDHSPNKRAKAVETLLDSPKYTEQWTNYWNHLLMGGKVDNARLVDKGAFRQWLHAEFEKNTPWNKFVYDMITASGQNSDGRYNVRTGMLKTAVSAPEDSNQEINGATNWILRFQGKPEDLSGTASKIFMGVQIQCAQCHDHKTEKWKQDDFRRFTACFVNTRPMPVNPAGFRDKMVRDYRVDLTDINRPFVPRGKNAGNTAEYAVAKPTALDGTDFSDSANRRQALAQWMTAKENPWFAEAIVNRMWSHFLGRGFIEPVDDIRPSNPAVMPDLMSKIADDFVAGGYDLKRLIKTICATQVYQLSSAPAAKTDPANKLWARYRLKPMTPEQMVDSLVEATNLQPVLEKVAGANLENVKLNIDRQFSFLFDVDEEFEQKDFEGTIPQALMLLNGNLTNKSVMPIPGTALADLMEMPGDDAQKIEMLYLRTLSRRPTAAETARWEQFVNQPREVVTAGTDTPAPGPGALRRMAGAGKQGGKRAGAGGFDPLTRVGNRVSAVTVNAKEQAYEDLFWALLNSSEFIFNH